MLVAFWPQCRTASRRAMQWIQTTRAAPEAVTAPEHGCHCPYLHGMCGSARCERQDPDSPDRILVLSDVCPLCYVHNPPATARGPMAFGLRLARHFFLSCWTAQHTRGIDPDAACQQHNYGLRG
jgi:hypothetical protein